MFEGATPGFDSIVGNPPFAGKNTITRGNRTGFLDWLKVISPGAHGNADLSAHFFRRAYGLLRTGGAMGLIATNTIGQGDTRESGLRYLLAERNAGIYRARRRVKWPGDAAVVVSTVHMAKGGAGDTPIWLDGRPVSRISAFVREGDFDDTPAVLVENKGIAFQGSIILGMGFTFDDENAAKGKATSLARMQELIDKNPRNAERIKPYLGGSEVNTDPEHKHHRYVIDFEGFPLRRDENMPPWGSAHEHERTEMLRKGVVPGDYPDPVAADWPDLLEIVERMVKPDRDRDNRPARRDFWWRFAERAKGLNLATVGLESVVAISCDASPHHAFGRIKCGSVFAKTLGVISLEDIPTFAILQSRVHEIWVRVFGSSMKDDLRYTPSDCFNNFPISMGDAHKATLAVAGHNYLTQRAEIMLETNFGLTKTYNRFHDPLDRKHDITELRRLHAAMDDAVLRAYDWDDLADLAQDSSPTGSTPRFLHQTDEPEFAYQKRYHWPAWFRDKVLARLLELNRTRADEEAKAGTDGKMKPKALQLDHQGTLI